MSLGDIPEDMRDMISNKLIRLCSRWSRSRCRDVSGQYGVPQRECLDFSFKLSFALKDTAEGDLGLYVLD
jgi:hypothetical protein